MSDHVIMGALVAARDYLRTAANPETTYGYFPGGDPRNFHPDPECCTPVEMAAHKAACEAWDGGDRTEHERHHHKLIENTGGRTVIASMAGAFGLGTYQFRDEDAEDVLDQVEAALSSLSGGSADGR